MSSNIAQKAVAVLLRGQGCANSLKTLLQNNKSSSVSTEQLINTILNSFSLALSFVDSPNHLPHNESSLQNMTSHVPQRPSKKKNYGAEGLVFYRDESPTPRDDGFTWRKYGQKTIKTSPHQRALYICAYAKDQNCNAKKRVQMIQDSPPVYRTTYVGKHVCKDFAVHDDTYGSEMIKFDQVVSKSVMPQLATIEEQEITMEDEATDHIMNQEGDINDFLVDDDQFWATQFPPFSLEDLMFF
ncbi:predicted protein [Arabidopsis lyrata subsp. lyrata]|uniref:Predicted protein n=1 Tax=Arabidopsis lyrata subsp. lyrata TaxID=81972 RepID=D7KTR7_ARALL|nr:predicted protein [Arabidopsis lyrata subsp. lyrata]